MPDRPPLPAAAATTLLPVLLLLPSAVPGVPGTGDLPPEVPGQEAAPTVATALRGDVTGDGAITALDALGTLSAVVAKPLPEGWRPLPHGDADCSGDLSALDALVILSHVVERDVSAFCVGGSVAAAVSASPERLTLPVGDTLTLEVRLLDDAGDPVAAGARLSTSDPSVAVVDAGGRVTAVGTGTASVLIDADGVADTVDLSVFDPSRASLTLVAGDGQAAAPGVRLPAPVRVRATGDGAAPLPWVPVRWVVTGGGGTVDSPLTLTDPDGFAQSRWRMGPAAGPGTLEARAHGLDPAAATATAAYPASVTRTWVGGDGAGPTTWSHAANWSPAGVPGAADTVLVPASVEHQPGLTAAATVGGLIVEDGATLDVGSFTLTSGGPLLALGAVQGDGTVAFTGTSVVGGSVPSLHITGTATASADVEVAGDLTLDGGALTLAGRAVRVGGDLLQRLQDGPEEGLLMTNSSDRLEVAGNATFTVVQGHHSATTAGKLTAGVLEVRGDFTQSRPAFTNSTALFASTGTRVVFRGTGPQDVSFSVPGGSHFHDLDVTNPAGVTLRSDVRATGQVSVLEGGVLSQTAGGLSVTTALPLTDAGTYAVPSTHVAATVTQTRDQRLQMRADGTLFIDAGAALHLDGHALHLTGSFRQNLVDGAAAGLFLTDPADSLVVDGDATFSVVQGHHSATTVGKLTAGVLRVRGDLAQVRPAFTNSTAVLASTGTRVVLDGAGEQTVSFAVPGLGGSRLHDLEVTNPAGVGFAGDVYVTGALTVHSGGVARQRTGQGSVHLTSSLPVPDGGTYDVMHTRVIDAVALPRDLDLALPDSGTLHLQGAGSLTLGGHALHVRGHLVQNLTDGAVRGLVLTHEADSLDVDGSVTFTVQQGHHSASTMDHLTAGVLRVGGDFAQSRPAFTNSTALFASTGTRVVLDGGAHQTVSFAVPGTGRSRFHALEVINPTGVTLASDVYATGPVTVVGGGVLRQRSGGSLYVTSAVPVPEDGVYDVMHTRIIGPTTLERDVLLAMADSGTLHVEGAGSLVPAGHALHVTGSFVQNLTDGADRGLILTAATDSVVVDGDATFTVQQGQHSATTVGKLTSGVLRVRGDFAQLRPAFTNSTALFASTGTRVVLDGEEARDVSFSVPGTQASRFHGLEVTNPAGVTLGSDVYADGPVRVRSGGLLRQRSDRGSLHVTSALPVTDGGSYDVMHTRVIGPVVLDRDLVLAVTDSGTLHVQGDGSLRPAGHALHVTGNVVQTLTDGADDGLFLVDPADSMVVDGDLTFTVQQGQHSASTVGKLTSGVLRVRGNFTQSRPVFTNSTALFTATGTRVVLDGSSPQTVSFTLPGASRFHGLELANPAGVVLGSAVHATGPLVSPDAVVTPVSGAGAVLQVGGLEVRRATFENVLVTVLSSDEALVLDDATFTGYGTGATQLTLRHPGAAFTFERLTFLTAPSTGLYLDVGDTSTDGIPLTVTLTSATPADPLGRVRQGANGGETAVVHWNP